MTPREAFLNSLWSEIVTNFGKGDIERAKRLEAVYSSVESLTDEGFNTFCDCFMGLGRVTA